MLRPPTFCTRPRRRVAVWSLLALAACTAPSMPGTLPPDASAAQASASIPPWAGMPLTWGKLDAIESWLASAPQPDDDYWSIEGQLQLSEGRLLFSKEEARRAPERLTAARVGFQRVIADTAASQDQIARAREGLELAASLGGAVPASAPNSVAGVVSRAQWRAARARPSRMVPHRGNYRYITIHHSAESVPPRLSGSLEDSAAAVRSMQRAHMGSRNYGDLGYHFVIDPNGRVFEGRQLIWQGAHAGGNNNVGNIGVCLIGNFNQERPSARALSALEALLRRLQSTWNIPSRSLRTHSDWKTTDCPGRYLRGWVASHR